MTEIADILQNISIILTCISIIIGIDAWRREFIGKRKIELAEDVLTRFYEARDAIARIRSPFSTTSEGSERKKSPGERPEEAALLDRAYVVFVRYEREQDLFNRLRSLRYQVMARISVSAAKPFDDLQGVVGSIFSAAHMLGRHYWPRQGRIQMTETEFKQHLEEMHKYEAIFWAGFDPKDPTAESVERTVAQIEAVCRPVLQDTSIGFVLTEPLARLLKKEEKNEPIKNTTITP